MAESSVVTLITCTGSRPEAFKLCHSYVKAQTYKGPVQWIVVNDSIDDEGAKKAQSKYPNFELYAGPRKWEEGINTQRGNLEKALEHVKGDYILVIEDDECYHPQYVEMMVKYLRFAEIVGESNAKYYNLAIPGFQEMGNFRHASLCQTGIRASLLSMLKKAVGSGQLYFDIHLWGQVHEKRTPCVLFSNANLCISMKNMPGRPGIGIGHQIKGYHVDPKLVKLDEWCGAYASNYHPFIKGKDGRADTTEKRSASGLSTKVPATSPTKRDATEIRHDSSNSKLIVDGRGNPATTSKSGP